MTTGRISVVTAVFNTVRFLGEAIESVLAQGEDLLEILVVDDGSTDGSAGVAERFGSPVRLIRQAHAGQAAAENRALAAARGDYVTFLDADDLYSPDKFALQAGRLDRNPDVDIVIGQKSYLRSDTATDGQQEFSEHHDDHLALSFGACMVRRGVFDRVGLLDVTMELCEDWDWFMRVREAGVPLLLHRHVVLRQRLHEANSTRDRDAGARFTLEMMRRSLARRRRGLGAATSLPPLATFFEPEYMPS